ncbi:MAG: hypothetical protein ACYC66_16795, partial [Chloroflexota bacterium]
DGWGCRWRDHEGASIPQRSHLKTADRQGSSRAWRRNGQRTRGPRDQGADATEPGSIIHRVQGGWRSRKPLSFFEDLFFWPAAYEKIVFGTDVHWSEMEWVLEDHRRIFGGLGLDAETRAKIFGGTMARLLGIGV